LPVKGRMRAVAAQIWIRLSVTCNGVRTRDNPTHAVPVAKVAEERFNVRAMVAWEG